MQGFGNFYFYGEWMGPGGSPGLQNRVCPDKIGTGGFDSHALPLILKCFATQYKTIA